MLLVQQYLFALPPWQRTDNPNAPNDEAHCCDNYFGVKTSLLWCGFDPFMDNNCGWWQKDIYYLVFNNWRRAINQNGHTHTIDKGSWEWLGYIYCRFYIAVEILEQDTTQLNDLFFFNRFIYVLYHFRYRALFMKTNHLYKLSVFPLSYGVRIIEGPQ